MSGTVERWGLARLRLLTEEGLLTRVSWVTAAEDGAGIAARAIGRLALALTGLTRGRRAKHRRVGRRAWDLR